MPSPTIWWSTFIWSCTTFQNWKSRWCSDKSSELTSLELSEKKFNLQHNRHRIPLQPRILFKRNKSEKYRSVRSKSPKKKLKSFKESSPSSSLKQMKSIRTKLTSIWLWRLFLCESARQTLTGSSYSTFQPSRDQSSHSRTPSKTCCSNFTITETRVDLGSSEHGQKEIFIRLKSFLNRLAHCSPCLSASIRWAQSRLTLKRKKQRLLCSQRNSKKS